MKNNFTKEVVIALTLVILAILLLNPFHFWMPDMVLMAMLALVLVVFSLFASFILRESARDERDSLHRMLAGRVAFLSGASVLMLGIVYQAYGHVLDVWLVIALIAMIVAKIAARLYSDKNY